MSITKALASEDEYIKICYACILLEHYFSMILVRIGGWGLDLFEQLEPEMLLQTSA